MSSVSYETKITRRLNHICYCEIMNYYRGLHLIKFPNTSHAYPCEIPQNRIKAASVLFLNILAFGSRCCIFNTSPARVINIYGNGPKGNNNR